MPTRTKGAESRGMPHRVLKTISSVIGVLRNQISSFREGLVLERGRLKYFREALDMEEFPLVVEHAKRISNENLFSTIPEIEYMEKSALRRDFVELIVQFIMIMQICERYGPSSSEYGELSPRNVWIFASCRSLTEMAYLRSRLSFVDPASFLREHINLTLVRTVESAVSRKIPPWEGMLLLCKEAGPGCVYRLLPCVFITLLNEPKDVPATAASLFLSIIAEAIYTLSKHFGNYTCKIEEKILVKLLDMGASPMVTLDSHYTLFRRIEKSLEMKGTPRWILDEVRPNSQNAEPRPTVLNRLMTHRWSDSFTNKLKAYACCSLGATDVSRQNFGSKLSRLECLAARCVPREQMDALPPAFKFFVTKHLPLPIGSTRTYFA
ncbi:uncharacterized protein LOC100899155 [Galendromus occidentalis]|uniref:Uncharacterized protein LOC100899155 n=1 Tax=Galendromus occidentalis TaxID=34638 RepID=A0AAJ6QYR7_9ACAR|nr:uncharacterized protein LOC100899155 [Galendromus occidentalis]